MEIGKAHPIVESTQQLIFVLRTFEEAFNNPQVPASAVVGAYDDVTAAYDSWRRSIREWDSKS